MLSAAWRSASHRTPAARHLHRLLMRDLNTVSGELSLGHKLPEAVRIVEVGPRDGLQNEKELVPTDIKVELINRLADSGLQTIEATSFVSPKWVPQLADAADVMQQIQQRPGVSYPVLVPNMKGLEKALEVGVKEVSIFAAATDAFSRRNTNCSVEDSIARFKPVMRRALDAGMRVRGYVSCVVGCPIQGEVKPAEAARVAGALHDMGCYEVSMGDTIGVGTPLSIVKMFQACQAIIPTEHLAAHLHDTYGQGVANTFAALQLGISVIDSSVAGLGGCPYAKGATGNVATEDVVYLLDGHGISHGIDFDRLLNASQYITNALGKETNSRAGKALLSARQQETMY